MIRENQRLFNMMNVVIDALIVLFAVSIVNSSIFTKYTHLFFNHDYLSQLVLYIFLIPSYILFYYIFGLYTPQRTNRSIFSESSKILRVIVVEFIFMSVLLLLNVIRVDAYYIVSILLVTFVLAAVERSLLRLTLRKFRQEGFNIKYVLIIGAGEVGARLADTISVNSYLGYKIMGFLDDNVTGEINNVKVIGKITDIEKILARNLVDRVIVSISPRHYNVLGQIIESCEKMGVRADIVPDYYQYVSSNFNVELIDDIPLISVRNLPLDITFNRYIKRIFDVVFVIVVSIIISPLLILVAMGVKLTSPGPVIYKQERVGENGRVFMIYKFRSMTIENEYVDDQKWTQKNDPRVTNFGKFIRRTSIDELPQFYNILKGDMSLIGPRPERPYFVRKFRESVPKYMIKHHVRPGMAGWAQINGYRGNTSIVERIKYDIFYVENWSIWLDIKIFLRTIPMLLFDQNAY
ncbi:undecaprenyl-phosphate glucose phosphotransferase [Methanosphaera sp. BMS]|uniref:undecaprenyl-phosphate glucose phosphotransferase n=1 Tax=Methanosphaera sp. BMS TaxID=1789762 RepID=UPI000DC1F2C7|nr:undecaprenyl-phosphate glucose phosphotransferase [Methanosphaera sp. BMS]AWX32691.1 undecaprenyl-phosphate glucose phosphotransferase [Methanosphaera sp. BMS]